MPKPADTTTDAIDTPLGTLALGHRIRATSTAGDIYEFVIERIERRPEGYRGWMKGEGWEIYGQSFGPVTIGQVIAKL